MNDIVSVDSLPAAKLSEKEFQAQVVAAAETLGWEWYHTQNSRRSKPGFPDLVLVHTERKETLYVELKTDVGRLTPAQVYWGDVLRDAGNMYYLWRPRDMDFLLEILAGDYTNAIPDAPHIPGDKAMPLQYYGGKSKGGVKSKWILSHLPAAVRSQTYIEPFGGMAAVLLHRDPVKVEIYNDVNARLVNWWEVVKREPLRFGWMIQATPYSRRVFSDAIGMLDDMSLPAIERAWAFHVVISQGINQGDGGNLKPSNWGIHYKYNVGTIHCWPASRFLPLAARMQQVEVHEMDGIALLERNADSEYAVIYCDPPYPSADTSAYLHSEIDVDRLTAALHAQKGYVAISGYGDEWDHLGWHRHELNSFRIQIKTGVNEKRVEALWTNHKPPQKLL